METRAVTPTRDYEDMLSWNLIKIPSYNFLPRGICDSLYNNRLSAINYQKNVLRL